MTNRLRKIILAPAIALFMALTFMFTFTEAFAAELTAETEATVTFEAGELELLEAPIINFGTHYISSAHENYQATDITGEIAVSDLRGSTSGWKLVAQLSAFNLGSVGTDSPTLNGAYITITDQNVYSPSSSVSASPTAASSAVLVSASSSQLILSATENSGMGLWNSALSNDGTVLTVLSGTASQGISYAVMDWTLEDTP